MSTPSSRAITIDTADQLFELVKNLPAEAYPDKVTCGYDSSRNAWFIEATIIPVPVMVAFFTAHLMELLIKKKKTVLVDYISIEPRYEISKDTGFHEEWQTTGEGPTFLHALIAAYKESLNA